MKKIQYTEYPKHYNAEYNLENQIKSQIKSVWYFIKMIWKKLLTRDDIELHYNLWTLWGNHISIDWDLFIYKENWTYKFTINIRKVNENKSKLYYSVIYRTNNLKDLLEEFKKHLDLISIDM